MKLKLVRIVFEKMDQVKVVLSLKYLRAENKYRPKMLLLMKKMKLDLKPQNVQLHKLN